MTWNIWTISTHYGDLRDLVASYSNRGQAIAKLRGLRRRAWKYRSEMQYLLRRG